MIPKRLTVDGNVVKVVYDTGPYRMMKGEDMRLYPEGGKYEKGVITMVQGVPVAHDRETLLHELLHFLTECAGIGRGKWDEETFVTMVSPWLLAALRENPQLIEYLMEA